MPHRSGDRGGQEVGQPQAAKWGLMPSWASDTGPGGADDQRPVRDGAELPAFRSALHRRRCLVPADGWFGAPRRTGAGAAAVYMTPRSGEMLAFAGLDEIWGADR